MMKNNKGQAMTKPFTVIFILVVIAILSISMNNFGRDVAVNPNNNLDNDSLNRIYDQSGFVPSVYRNGTGDSTDLFFSSDLNTSGNAKDYALEFQFYREQSSSIRTLVQDLWNLPVFFINGLDLDLQAWNIVINIWNTVIWAIIFFVIYRVVRGIL